MTTIQEQIAYVGRRMFERRLTDMSGANISVREGNTIYLTPRYSGSKKHWQLTPEDIISGDLDRHDLPSQPLFSREGLSHLAIYREFPEIGAVIHAHPFHILPFCVAERPLEPVLESGQKFGRIDVIKFAPAHSAELAENVVAGLRGKEEIMRKQAAAVLLPRHGIFVAGKDLLGTVDALERLDWNAWCILAQAWLPPSSVTRRF